MPSDREHEFSQGSKSTCYKHVCLVTANSGESSAAEPPGSSDDAVTRAVRELPLDPADKTLNNTMPDNAAVVERRLGLRRTRAPGIDMRQRTPTSAEVVDALEPAKDSHR